MMEVYELGTSIKLSVIFRDQLSALIDPTTITLLVYRPDGTTDTVVTGDINHPSTGAYNAFYTTVVKGDHTYTWTGLAPALDYGDVHSGFFVVVQYNAADVDYLIPVLRYNLGDYDATRYTSETLRQALIFAVKMLMRKWNARYSVDTDGVITRNAQHSFADASPPIVMVEDEPPVVIQAAIIVKSGSLQEASWQTASWRDDEIQVSNIQGQRSREKGLTADIALLESYFKLKLYAGRRQALPGFKYPPNWREG